MIDDVRLESDDSGWVLVLEDDFGTHTFPCDPQQVEEALEPWREHELEGSIVRAEFLAAGGISWDAYKESQARTDPEFDALAEAVDHFRKAERERGDEGRDYGDEDAAA